MPSVHSQHKGGGLRPPPQRGAAFGRPPFVVSLVLRPSEMKECCSQTSFSELNTGTGSSPRGGARTAKVSNSEGECCSKKSFSELTTGTSSSPRGGARTAKVSKSEGVLSQKKLFGTRPRNPAHPWEWCQRTTKVSKSGGALFQNKLFGTRPPLIPRIPGSGVMTRCWGPPFHTRRGAG